MRLFPVVCFFAVAAPSPAFETLLVLPFFNRTGQENLNWIGESVAEDLRETLSGAGVMMVTREDRREAYARLSVRPYAPLTKATVIRIAETLDAAQVVFGRVEWKPPPAGSAPASRGSLHLTAQILDLRNLRAMAEFSVLGALEDLGALQSHLCRQALRHVLGKRAPSEEEFRRSRPVVRVDAVEYYIRGLMAADEEQRHHFLTQAVRLDPSFTPPCFELGKMQWEKKHYQAAVDWLARVTPAHSRHTEATFLLGVSRFYLGDYPGAQRAFESVLNEVPLNEVYNNLGVVQLRRGLPEAIGNLRKALEGDSNDPGYHFNLGYAYWKRGDFESGAESFRAAAARDPNDQDATLLLGRCLQRSGPRPGDNRVEGLERVKITFEESAYRQLRSILEGSRQ
jgi:tetratricopeptide (TPR) repeat protein